MMKEERFTLDMLSGKMREFLEEYDLLDAQHDGRVSEVPDARTIRYYTTIGLLDRPLMEARQAWYKRRHVLQILSIKALQSRHIPLAEIQSALYGKTDQELDSLLRSLLKEKKSDIPVPVVWRELVIQPGLKIQLLENFSSSLSMTQLQDRILKAINVLTSSDRDKLEKKR